MKTVAVIPVRMGSSRLFGKVMTSVMGKPLLGYLLDRVERCALVDEIVVAASSMVENDLIESYCSIRNVLCFRGSETNVLDRLLQALTWRDATTGVLVFGDGPLIDPGVIAHVVQFFCSHTQFDFVSNDLQTTFPPGMEVEVFKVASLADSASRCADPEILEHGTLYMRQHPDLYQLHNLDAPPHWCRPDVSLEVDVREDLEVVEAIVEAFNGRADTTLIEIIQFMDQNPHLANRNRDIPRRWKAYRVQ